MIRIRYYKETIHDDDATCTHCNGQNISQQQPGLSLFTIIMLIIAFIIALTTIAAAIACISMFLG